MVSIVFTVHMLQLHLLLFAFVLVLVPLSANFSHLLTEPLLILSLFLRILYRLFALLHLCYSRIVDRWSFFFAYLSMKSFLSISFSYFFIFSFSAGVSFLSVISCLSIKLLSVNSRSFSTCLFSASRTALAFALKLVQCNQHQDHFCCTIVFIL